VARPRAGVTRIAIHAPDARTVQLCGDWNGWKPEPARRASNGVWYVDLALEPGEYRYAFRVNGAWRVPEGAVAVDDGFGGRAAYVTVPRRSAGQ
jgi:1,4-alpha-glucan branching enzyme